LLYIKKFVAQWVYPHTLGLGYLKHFKVSKNVGKLYNLD